MKKKFLILLPLTFLTFSCTNIIKSVFQKDSNNSESTEPGFVETPSDSDGSGLDPIDNEPVHSYQADTVKAIHSLAEQLASNYGMGNADDLAWKIETYFIKLGIGDELAKKICQTYSSTYTTFAGQTIETITAQQYKQYYYDVLNIMSSIDFSKIADLLDYFNDLYVQEYKDELRALSLKEMYPLSYANGTLDKIATVYDDPSFLEAYNSFKIDDNINIVYTQDQITSYNNRRTELQQLINDGFIPKTIISFIRENGGKKQTTVINDLKSLVDNLTDPYVEFLKLYQQYYQSNATTQNQSSENVYLDMYNVEDYESAPYSKCLNGSYSLLSRNYNESSSAQSFPYADLLRIINNNKRGITKVLTTFLDSGSSSELLLDVFRKVVFPVYFSRYSTSNSEILQARQQFLSKLNALNPSNLNAIARFVCNFIDGVTITDLSSIFENPNSEESKTALKNAMTTLQNLINRTSSSDKSLILEVSNLFGVDILNELNTVANYFINRNLYTDEQFYNLIEAWQETLEESFENTFEYLFSSDDHYSSSGNSNANEYVSWYIETSSNRVVQNQTITPSDVRLNYDYYDSNSPIYFYGNLQSLSEAGSITIDSFEYDFSNVGYVIPNISVTITANGHKLNFNNTITVYPADYQPYSYLSLYSSSLISNSASQVVYGNMDYFVIVSQNATCSYYSNETYQNIAVDTSETGFHCVVEGTRFVVYYVAPLSSFSERVNSIGYGIAEASKMVRSTNISRYIEVPSLGQTYAGSYSFSFEGKEGIDYTPGLHTYRDSETGKTFEYMIFSLADAYSISKNIYAGSLIPYFYKALGMEIPTNAPAIFSENMPNAIAVNVYLQYYFNWQQDGRYLYGSYSYTDVMAMQNISVSGNIFSFTFNGQQYRYTINSNALYPLSEVDFTDN